MKKNVDVIPIATVLAGFRSTKQRQDNIKRLYTFVKQIKKNEGKNYQ